MRIGLFGGSFDPVHYGHLWIVMAAWEQLQLDELRMLPAAQSPLKPGGVHAAAEQRLEMLRLATGGTDPLIVDDRELRRGGVSYTVETLRSLSAQQDGDEWLLIIGSDSLASFPRWHEPQQILQRATLAVVQRGGDPPIDYTVLQPLCDAAKLRRCQAAEIQMPQIELSSSELRQRVAGGRSIRFRTPRAVEAYIEAQALYRAP
ncbi:nicotinate (nicotinamide) nucleotide adenylyltransferase [Roseimaritima ulvae]|uniref:Probable nicotinate-nucleotide adenylyltransferase n=1 Tax=Roseimaritima ulvae TaxID=980254 RepID=A0A5B9R0S3_9BACT|nr:nicotinate (nicotinamide) nucleotide adenylyltransferase [Roseimaritima ulvae]QEG43016.1 Nicotinate-nucleotide adenylyltransferase [Roseimaritima ulvae]